MNLRNSLKLALILIGTLGALGIACSSSPAVNQPAQNKNIASVEEASYGLPVRIQIPKINVDAALEHVGLTPDGAMDVPKDRAKAAWFNQGPRPGEQGTAVIDGHYGILKNGKPSIFDDLNKLIKGDKLYILDEKGITTPFIVTKSQTYEPDADTSAIFYSTDGKSHLNIITCEGVWDKAAKSYSKRLVVFTDKENEKI